MMVTKSYAVYQSNEQTSLKNKEVEPVQPVQINIYEGNTYILKKSQWFKRGSEERTKNLHIRFCNFLEIPSSKQQLQPRHYNSIPYMAVDLYRDMEQPQEKETSQNESSNHDMLSVTIVFETNSVLTHNKYGVKWDFI